MEYKTLAEIADHNFAIESRELDMLIALSMGMITTSLTDTIRLHAINHALNRFGGTVAEALIETVYNNSL